MSTATVEEHMVGFASYPWQQLLDKNKHSPTEPSSSQIGKGKAESVPPFLKEAALRTPLCSRAITMASPSSMHAMLQEQKCAQLPAAMRPWGSRNQ